MTLSRLRSKAEAADILHIHLKTLERRIHDGEIGVVRDGRRVFITDEQLAEYIAARTIDAAV
jgi:excisionase family DNA binding protein